jgi:hypothetical protein
MIVADDPERGPGAVQLADTFCRQARVRVDALFDQLWTNTDEPDRSLARSVIAGELSWLEDGTLDPSIPGEWIAAAAQGPATKENVHRSTTH